eukprot:jgi/Mesvir1/7791/Mv11734-RA.1
MSNESSASNALIVANPVGDLLKEIVAKGRAFSKLHFDGKLPLPLKEDLEVDPVQVLRGLTNAPTGQIRPFIPEKTHQGARLFHVVHFLRFLTERWAHGVPPPLLEAVKNSGGTCVKIEGCFYACAVMLANLARAVPCGSRLEDREKRSAVVNEWFKSRGLQCRVSVEEISTDRAAPAVSSMCQELERKETKLRFEILDLEDIWSRYNSAFRDYERDHKARESFPTLSNASNYALRRLPVARHELDVVMQVLATPELLRSIEGLPIPRTYEYDPRMALSRKICEPVLFINKE